MPDPLFPIGDRPRGVGGGGVRVKLVEEHARDIHCSDEQNLPVELEELSVCVVGVEDKRAVEAEKLSKLVVDISNSLVDLGTLPIRDIPQLSKMAQEVLVAVRLILERLREEHASATGYWD
jgi:hypothetical protein